MPINDIEVFEYLTSGDTSREINYITYAIFALRRAKWIDHWKEQNDGNPPSQAEIDHWTSQITSYDFEHMKFEAADYFHFAAQVHLKEEVESEVKEGIESSILAQVRAFTSWPKHLAIALGMAVLAPIILGGMILLIGIFDSSFPVHVSITTSGVEKH